MKRTFISDIQETGSKEVLLKGWVHKIRSFKDFAFVLLRDKSGVVQLVVNECEELKELKHQAGNGQQIT